ADAVQIVNTCAGIVRAGAQVDLHVESFSAPSVGECLAFYGIDLGADHQPFAIEGLGPRWSWPIFPLKTRASVLKRSGGRDGCLFVREVRPYVPGLMARAHAAGLKVIFEAHNVSTSLVQEKESKQRVFSIVSPEGKAALKLVGEGTPEGHGHGHEE